MLPGSKVTGQRRAVQRFGLDRLEPQQVNAKAGLKPVQFHHQDRPYAFWCITGAGQ